MERDETNCLFLTGMGGIGKSTLVRECIANCHERLDAVLYLYYNGSMQKTIADDGQLRINTVERMQEESTEDYFRRKVRVLRDLAAGKRILLVVDNFEGTPDEDFAAVLGTGCKTIVVSRREVPDTGYATLRLREISDREELYALFECYLRRELDETEFDHLDEIIRAVLGHTLALQLIARQVECSHISIAQAAALLREKGFSDMAPEKVDYVKDWQLHQNTVARIVHVIFQADHMLDRKKALLKALSMFPAAGVDINVFSDLTMLETKDPLNELAREGWMQMEGRQLSLHPVVQEVVRRWEWSRMDWDVCGLVMYDILERIELETQRENIPWRQLLDMQLLKACMEEDPATDATVREYAAGKGLEGDFLLKCIENSNQGQITDRRKLRVWLDMAESVLDYCRRETDVREMKMYYPLLYVTVMNMPPDREDYILEHAKEWLASLEEDGWDYAKGKVVLDLYDRIISIYEEREESRMAYFELKKVERIARESRHHYLKGQYYMILVGYLQSITDWYYGKNAQTGNILKLLFAVGKAIWHLKRDRTDDSKVMYTEALLSKVYLLTLSFPWRYRKIIRLLVTAKGIVEACTQEYAKIRKRYYVTEAWFYTLILRDYEEMTHSMLRAEEIAQATADMPLSVIDDVILPWMAMLGEFRKYEEAAEKLKKGIQMCEKDEYKGIIPYIRKRVHLYACLLDMYYLGGDFTKCREVIGIIDEENSRNREYGVVKVIEEGYREEIFNG
ncbi:NB-ARC domain-containing protein [Acetatifactor aquisgranensis]|uniref:NB-ARC domain-containing protein n=1 Tax=Acetatifactor aquisgranensis TaxID=2941233 RepID=UPI00203DAA56|nr:NB-ARC domain-containing protein [Acetatifactor aquisgranensis]